MLENKLIIGYSDEFTLIAVVPFPGIRITVAEFLNYDVSKVSEWCYLWGIKLNASKTKTDRPQVMHNASPITPFTICGTVLKESDDLDIF